LSEDTSFWAVAKGVSELPVALSEPEFDAYLTHVVAALPVAVKGAATAMAPRAVSRARRRSKAVEPPAVESGDCSLLISTTARFLDRLSLE
jgi:hypothetical protein